MSLRSDTKRFFDVFNMENEEPDFLAGIALKLEFLSGYLYSGRIVVDRDPNDVFDIALDGVHPGSVGAKRGCQKRTGRAAYSAQCPRVVRPETGGEQVVQGF